MRAVSVFPLDEFRLALKKVYGAAAPKGPFTALSQATLFFSRNSCTIACCNLNQWCQATIPAQGDEFSLTLYDTQRLLDACAYFSGELHLEYETAEKKPHNCDIPYNQARFSCGGREIHQLVFDSDLYPLPKEFQPEQVYQINAGTVFGLFIKFILIFNIIVFSPFTAVRCKLNQHSENCKSCTHPQSIRKICKSAKLCC